MFRGEHINFLARLTLGQPAVCPRAIWTLTRAKSLCLCAFFSRRYKFWPFFTQISGRNFLPEIFGEVHPETAPLQALSCALCSTEQSTFWGGKRVKRCRDKGRKRGGQQRGQKGKKDAWKQVRISSEIENFKRATHEGPIYCGEFWRSRLKSSSEIEVFKRWRQIWRVAGRGSGSRELLGSPRTSPEVFRRLPRKFSHCGTRQQSRGSPEVPQTSLEVPRTSPEVSRTSPEVSPFLWEDWHPLLTRKNFLWKRDWKFQARLFFQDSGP